MVDIGKVKNGSDITKGKFVKVSQMKDFQNGRSKIGLLLNTDEGQLWFNLYGEKEQLLNDLKPLEEGDTIECVYTTRNFTSATGYKGVSREIQDFEIVSDGKFQKTLPKETKVPKKLDLELLATMLRDTKEYINSTLYEIEQMKK